MDAPVLWPTADDDSSAAMLYNSVVNDETPDKTVVSLDPLVCPCSTMFRIDAPHLAWTLEHLVRGEVVLGRGDRPVLFFGLSDRARVRALNIVTRPAGITFTLVLPGEQVPVELQTHGRFMVGNALAAGGKIAPRRVARPACGHGAESGGCGDPAIIR